MKLHTRLNLVVSGLTAAFVIVLISAEVQNMRASVREEIEAANRVASQLLGRLPAIYSSEGGLERLRQFLRQLGRVRANDITLRSPSGVVLYRSPQATYKAGRDAPIWFVQLLAPVPTTRTFALPDGAQVTVASESSRAVLDAWDDMTRLLTVAVAMLVLVNALAFWIVGRALRPFPIIVEGLERIQQGDLAFRLPDLPGAEAHLMGAAFNRMAQGVQGKVQAERKMREAEIRLEDGREMALLVEQRLEEERRLIAHELHDEFGQSVTAIRSLALAIATQCGTRDAQMADVARLISDEAAKLYDAMHGLIPRLMPLTLTTLGLAESLQGLVHDWQRRNPAMTLSITHELSADIGPSMALAIYRVVQEGLINALRHAQASRIDIVLRSTAEQILVSVSDDGVGLPEQWSKPGHFGLRGLSERVGRLGGVLTLAGRTPRGACLSAQIPLTAAA